MKFSNENIIRLGLAAVLLICLIPMPSGYFQFIQFIIVLGFAFLAYYAYEGKNTLMAVVFILLAFLYAPILKLGFEMTVWNIIDGVVAVGLILLTFLKRK
ncbi:MAG: hypothetical protein Q8867_10670 [Bacteroidota bacterium]|nr:hypothetical protein [Bacteroidota bacterium]